MTGTERHARTRPLPDPRALTIELNATSRPAIVSEFRHAAGNFARRHGADERGVEDVELAVSEAVTNAVKYAYEEGEDGRVGLLGSVADGWLEIQVLDRGHGFRGGRSDGLGLGLSIIAQTAGDLTISQGERGTNVRMRFLVPRGDDGTG